MCAIRMLYLMLIFSSNYSERYVHNRNVKIEEYVVSKDCVDSRKRMPRQSVRRIILSEHVHILCLTHVVNIQISMTFYEMVSSWYISPFCIYMTELIGDCIINVRKKDHIYMSLSGIA